MRVSTVDHETGFSRAGVGQVKRAFERIFSRQAGLTLLELTVVSGILTLLAALVAISVSGRTEQGRGTAQTTDVSVVQSAIESYAGQQPQGRYPTFNGCLDDGSSSFPTILDTVTGRCVVTADLTDVTKSKTTTFAFSFAEATAGVDLNGDGDTADTLTITPIIWEKAFQGSSDIQSFVPDHLGRLPKHAYDFLGTGSGNDSTWSDASNTDPDGIGKDRDPASGVDAITAPEGTGTGANKIDVSIDQVPVWGIVVVNGSATVVNLIAEGSY